MINSTVNDLYGIYIHIPFCLKKCFYCNFYSIQNLSMINDYFLALHNELKFYNDKKYKVDTIYFGGGTPSVVQSKYIKNTIDFIYKYFEVVPNPEITIEINPGTADNSKLIDYYSFGINRLNIGMQSIQNRFLNFLGRLHSSEEAIDFLNLIKSIGFNNVGLDFIYGIPGQSITEWENELTEIIKLKPEHLSCYSLTIESDTLIGDKVKSGELLPPDDRITSSMFSLTNKFLNDNGYYQYEVSNFSKCCIDGSKHYISKHNNKYWNFNNYIGFGPSAHSYENNIRWSNSYSIKDYIKNLIVKKKLPIETSEFLTFEQQIIEFMYLGLRQKEGISISAFEKRFGENIFQFFSESILVLVQDGFIQIINNRIRLTNLGFLFLDSIILWFCP